MATKALTTAQKKAAREAAKTAREVTQEQQATPEQQPVPEEPQHHNKQSKVKTVRMRYVGSDACVGPDKADVHPLEVENWRDAGWVEE